MTCIQYVYCHFYQEDLHCFMFYCTSYVLCIHHDSQFMSSNLIAIDCLSNDFFADSLFNSDHICFAITIPLAPYILTIMDVIQYFFSQFCSRHIFQLLALNFHFFSSFFDRHFHRLCRRLVETIRMSC